MYQTLLVLHNLLRWVILLLLVIAIVRALAGMNSARPFTNGEKKTGLFLMIAAHTTLLIGLYQWFAGPWGLSVIRNYGFGEVMKNSVYRFWSVEHITGTLIAITLITIGRGVSKKNIPDRRKHRKTFWFYLAALVLLLVIIPWPSRPGIGRPLLPTVSSQQVQANN